MKLATRTASGLMAIVAIAHLLRLVLGVHVTVAGHEIPMWVSAAGIALPAALAVGLWREARS